MPPVPTPNVIELRDFRGGQKPNLTPASLGPTELLDALNLVPDKDSGALVTRKGFASVVTINASYFLRTVSFYSTTSAAGVRTDYVICVLDNAAGDNVSDNVRVYAVNLGTGVATWISRGTDGTSGVARTWLSGNARHWGETLDGVFYGGGLLDPPYSWDGTTWKVDPSAHDFKTMVDPTAGITLASEVSSDKAFRKRDKVRWSDADNPSVQSYRVAVRNRFAKWQSGRDYSRHTRVSIRRDWFANSKLWYKSFRCKRDNTASAVNRPGDGTGSWQDFWRPVILDSPRDEETIISDDWDVIPEAASTAVATFHDHRLFMRYDDIAGSVGLQRVQYSAPDKRRPRDEIQALRFDPKDFAIGDDEDGPGGGWLPDLQRNEPITALFSYGNYLLIFQRNWTWALQTATGDDSSWSLREIGDVGAQSMRAITNFKGTVYFIGPNGLHYTDGTAIGTPAGAEVINAYISRKLDSTTGHADVTMWTSDDFVWFSIPSTAGGDPAETWCYDPERNGFFKQSFAVFDAALAQRFGQEYVYFSQPGSGATKGKLYQFAPSAQEPSSPTDDGTAISWNARTSWMQFGLGMHMERRIRRIWTLVKSPNTGSLKAYRNFSDTAYYTQSLAAATTPTYLEGNIVPDSGALSLETVGTGKAELHGFGVHTQPRRVRYGRN
jgi:hypothetical protein